MRLARDNRAAGAFILLSWSSFVAAAFLSAALGLVFALAQQAQLTSIDCVRIINFVPGHLVHWRCTWLVYACASVAFLATVVALRPCLERRFHTLAAFAVALVVVATSASVEADMSLLVMFSDLAQELSLNYSINHLGTVHLSWVTISHFMIQNLLVANSLQSVAGLIFVFCIFLSRSLPRLVAWVGLPVWLVHLNATVIAAAGNSDLALLVLAAGQLLQVLWLAICGACFALAADKLKRSQKSPIAVVAATAEVEIAPAITNPEESTVILESENKWARPD